MYIFIETMVLKLVEAGYTYRKGEQFQDLANPQGKVILQGTKYLDPDLVYQELCKVQERKADDSTRDH